MMKKSVNIEFSHIYLGQPLREYHLRGAKLAKQTISILEKRGFQVTSNIWIDDIHFRKKVDKFNFAKQIITQIKKEVGIAPDFFAFESEIQNAAEKFRKEIPSDLLEKKRGNLYVKAPYPIIIKKGTKDICCFLSAAYALAKLGHFKVPVYNLHKTNKKFYADLQITILSKKYFKEEENKTKHLIKFSKDKNSLKDMSWVWYSNKKIPKIEELEDYINRLVK
jgi:hypothetical protein